MILRRPPQPQPRRLLAAAAGHRRQPEIDHDQGKAAADQHLSAAQRLLQPPGPCPEQPFEVDSGAHRRLRIEVVPQIDQRRRLPALGGAGQQFQHQGKAAAASGADQLDRLPAADPAAEQPVDAGKPRGERFGVRLPDSGRGTAARQIPPAPDLAHERPRPLRVGKSCGQGSHGVEDAERGRKTGARGENGKRAS